MVIYVRLKIQKTHFNSTFAITVKLLQYSPLCTKLNSIKPVFNHCPQLEEANVQVSP